ncbi:hypothetical protein KZ483_26025 [Paenibacillus sp. sptzw28]|uniref:hypothetical protein n=1 Tax=Paenibacillus sp. sptzw28 TaxID=715179 RepID=UPI001C6E0698|nr:hypothetical protein [Paenibacillus sp. sptzw28]QYR21128.1 hypothetical protein KZ483_26025 [Paenibacillus sp. sptzw28]
MFFSKKKVIEKAIVEPQITGLDQKLEAIIRYTHIYSGFYYGTLSKQFPAFKEVADDYSFAFMELYTVSALGVALHSPSISESNFYGNILNAIERQLPNYFENSGNNLYKNVIACIDFYKKFTIDLITSGYNFSDIPAYWLLHNFNVYKDFENDYGLISELGNELTNHYIYIFEDSWKPREMNPLDLLESYR